MEDRNFTLPNKAEYISDFRNIRKETTSAGNVRFVGERDGNGHSDRFWAGALCVMAGKQGGGATPGKFFRDVRDRRDKRDVRKWKGIRSI